MSTNTRSDEGALDGGDHGADGARTTARDEGLVERVAAKAIVSPAPVVEPASSRPHVPGIANEPPSRRFFLVVGPVAAVASLLLTLALGPSTVPLPSYVVSVAETSGTRRDPIALPSETVLDPGGDFELVARPSFGTPRMTVRALLVRDGKAAPWNAPVDVSHEGTIRVTGKNAVLFPSTEGRATIVLFLASGARQPSIAEATKMAERSEGEKKDDPSVLVLRADVRFARVAHAR